MPDESVALMPASSTIPQLDARVSCSVAIHVTRSAKSFMALEKRSKAQVVEGKSFLYSAAAFR